MHITVRVKHSYGCQHVYPECEKAKQFAAIAGTRTLTQAAIDAIKRLGFEVRVHNTTPAAL